MIHDQEACGYVGHVKFLVMSFFTYLLVKGNSDLRSASCAVKQAEVAVCVGVLRCRIMPALHVCVLTLYRIFSTCVTRYVILTGAFSLLQGISFTHNEEESAIVQTSLNLEIQW